MPRGDYKITLEERSGHSVIHLTGSVHLMNGERFRSELDALAPAATVVALDLSRLDYLDSNALVVLLSLHDRGAKSGFRLAILSPSDFVSKLLRITRLDEMIPVFADPARFEQALRDGEELLQAAGSPRAAKA